VIVADSSAVLDALVARPPNPALVSRLRDEELHAPHVVDLDVVQVLRRLERAGHLSTDRAEDARHDFADLALVRYPHEPLLERIWELRQNLTSYDAAYIALAEALEVPLVTVDAKLAATPGTTASIELLART
jgi:predicted nucleic acid-binding protein